MFAYKKEQEHDLSTLYQSHDWVNNHQVNLGQFEGQIELGVSYELIHTSNTLLDFNMKGDDAQGKVKEVIKESKNELNDKYAEDDYDKS